MSRVGTYTLRIEATDTALQTADSEARNQKVINEIGTALSEAEQVVNEWLPEGYYCKIDG